MSIDRLKDFLHELILTKDQQKLIYERFVNEIKKGLSSKDHDNADTKCFITYLQELPKGDEEGKYLALDLGGSNFRVLLVTMRGRHEPILTSKIYTLTKEIITGSGTHLFDHIAACLYDFMSENKLHDVQLPLGFTFSFPCVQLGLTKAMLVKWTKGFSSPGVVNRDVVKLLQEAIIRRGDLQIDIMAVLNDTTGTLMSCAHRNPDCRIGLIVGTGCNACYMERVENCELLAPEYKVKKNMIINIEWGAFGEHGALDPVWTDYDRIIDQKSLNKGNQIFEKMISGMYMGTLVSLILAKAIRENLVFNDCQMRAKLEGMLKANQDAIESKHVSEIEGDRSADCTIVRKIIKQILCLDKVSLEDCQKLKLICEVVSRRSGNLVGIGLSGLINKMNEPKIVVGVDGTVYRLHPKFAGYMRESMHLLVNPELKFDLMLSEDGSGRGAALVAATVAT